MGHWQGWLRMVPRIAEGTLELFIQIQIMTIEGRPQAFRPVSIVSLVHAASSAWSAYHRINQFDAIVLWRIMTSRDHNTDRLPVEFAGS